jgi:predicted site-specific integrase-resolvase
MKLSKWTKKQGITYQTGWNLFKAGKIKNAYQLESGTIIVQDDIPINTKIKTVVYARVSSSENKNNLTTQAERIVAFCNANGWQVDSVVKEIGSGLNDKRKKLQKIIESEEFNRIVVEHKDRFCRFGINYIQCLLKQQGRELIIINNMSNDKEDLMQDFVSIITSFVARLYGFRLSKRKTESIIKKLANEDQQ